MYPEIILVGLPTTHLKRSEQNIFLYDMKLSVCVLDNSDDFQEYEEKMKRTGEKED